MRASVVQIGNSKGIRIPKTLLEECNIGEQVELSRKGNSLVIHPIDSEPRRGWAETFSLMHKRGEDALLLDEGVDGLEEFEWK